jgi:RNA polymerase-binding transcription factor DksA
MTALDFIALGVVFTPTGGRTKVSGPQDPNLRAQLRHEISKREPHARVSSKRQGECQSCGDPMEPGRGGCCPLCNCAASKLAEAT